MRLPARVVAGALALVLVGDLAAVLLHDTATPYGADDALAQFRAETSASPEPAASTPASAAASAAPTLAATSSPPAVLARASARPATRPAAPVAPAPTPDAAVPPGVYSYDSSGHEEVDVLGGSRHDYPAQSTITYRRTGCGTEDRWQPLEERSSTDEVCPTALGHELRRSVQRRSFFGQSEEQVLVCDPGLVLVPADPRPGMTSRGTCRSDDTVAALTFRVLELVREDVGGRPVELVHISAEGRLTGSTRGTTSRETWLTRTGLLVRSKATSDTDRDTAGGTVHYTETYELRLRSLEPQR